VRLSIYNICACVQCFMNSVLQCLSHTRPLFNYCVDGEYKLDINPASSMGGALISGIYMTLTLYHSIRMMNNGFNYSDSVYHSIKILRTTKLSLPSFSQCR